MDYIPTGKPSSIYYLLFYFIKLNISTLCFQRQIFRDIQNFTYQQAPPHGKTGYFTEELLQNKIVYVSLKITMFISHSTTKFKLKHLF